MSRYERFADRYASGELPWDQADPPPEVLAYVPTLPPGRALDLGCGLGRASLFIAGLGCSRDDEVIVRAVLNLAEAFAVEAVAEGVETESQRDWLDEAGCRLAQGYLFSHPVDSTTAEALLRVQVHESD
mgnify:CR=1 FL=1